MPRLGEHSLAGLTVLAPNPEVMTQAKTLDYAHAPPPADPIPLRRRLAAEFVGTFALVFAGCGAIAAGVEHVGVALTFGLAITTMVYAVGDVSGAHFNPAVSFAFAISRRMDGRDAALYGAAQCVAAILSALILWAALDSRLNLGATVPTAKIYFPPESVHNQGPSDLRGIHFLMSSQLGPVGINPVDCMRAVLYEIVLSFFLVFVILCVAIGSKERGLMAGIAIGGTVAFCALAGGPVSGASMNPARSLGPALVTGGDAIKYLWIYWTAPFIGALIAVGAWTFIYRHPRMPVMVHALAGKEP